MVVLRGLLAGLLALALTGCSILTVRGAPDQPGPTPPDCTTSKATIYVDGALAAGAVGTSLFIGIAALANTGEKRSDLGYATLFTFLTSIPLLVSGIVGGARVSSCRKAHEQFRMMSVPPPYYGPPAPYPYPYPPAPSGPPGGT